MSLRRVLIAVLPVIALASAPSMVRAGFMSEPGAAGFTPQVPLSAFARPATWFDPSRLHLQSTVSVGSGFGGSGTSALQVTKLSYQFRAPLAVSVSLGNTFGMDKARNGGSPFFLEGFDVTWRPSPNAIFRVEMHDVRSPLQYGYPGYGYGYGPSFGRVDPFSTPY
jgi:hypothetical protein